MSINFQQIESRLSQAKCRVSEMTRSEANFEHTQNAAETLQRMNEGPLDIGYALYMGRLQNMLYLQSIGEGEAS